jgi:hypothetical protein
MQTIRKTATIIAHGIPRTFGCTCIFQQRWSRQELSAIRTQVRQCPAQMRRHCRTDPGLGKANRGRPYLLGSRASRVIRDCWIALLAGQRSRGNAHPEVPCVAGCDFTCDFTVVLICFRIVWPEMQHAPLARERRTLPSFMRTTLLSRRSTMGGRFARNCFRISGYQRNGFRELH